MGAKVLGFWWRDREFYKLCKSGIWSPAIWRLFDTGKKKTWSGARAQIYKDNEIAKKQVQHRKEYLRRLEEKKER